jgi:hypothetical protein
VNQNILPKLLFFLCFCFFINAASAQKAIQETYYYNPKGLTFIPALKKPSIIYQGRLHVGRKQLTGLFNHLNNQELNAYFKKYKANKRASAILNIAGIGLSAYSLFDWRRSDRKFNWYTFGGGLLIGGVSGYLDTKGNDNLRKAAIVFDKATTNTTFAPVQSTVSFTIPLSK